MKFTAIIYLLRDNIIVDEIGDVINAELERKVFASKKTVRQSEFYQAQSAGLRPELTFIIREDVYKNELALRYNNIRYKVIRVFSRNDGLIELVCQGSVNNADS